MKKHAKTLWPWVLGVTLGLVMAVVYAGVPASATGDDDAVVYEVDLEKEPTQADLEELVRFARQHEGRDIILRPAEGFQVAPGEERRARDEARAAREDRELSEHIELGRAEGLYVDGIADLPACATAKAQAVYSTPPRHLLCDSKVVAAPSRVPFKRAARAGQIEELLEERVYELLEGVSPEEEARGFTSFFSNPAALQTLRLGAKGAVELDFNDSVKAQIGHVHPGFATHTLLQQIFRTLFQFRDVASVKITLNGSCEGFGEMIGGPCQEIRRDLWEQMNSENGESVRFFNLKGRN